MILLMFCLKNVVKKSVFLEVFK